MENNDKNKMTAIIVIGIVSVLNEKRNPIGFRLCVVHELED